MKTMRPQLSPAAKARKFAAMRRAGGGSRNVPRAPTTGANNGVR
jgi:hypothetical protein